MLVLALPGFGLIASADEPKVTTSNDIVYTKAGGTDLKLDLAYPSEGNGPFPAVLVIHGGAWRAGDKASNRSLLTEFAKRGYVAISPQYRFCPKDLFPAQVHDVKAAVRWLRTHAQEYKIDSNHIGATGFSAGGHLALMLGVTGPKDGLEGDAAANAPSSKVQAVVNFFGPTELAASDLPEVSQGLVKDFLGGTPTEKAAEVAKASPLTFIDATDPPILTYQGTKDPLVPYTQANKLTEAMAKVGVEGRTELIIGAGHGWKGAELKHSLDGAYEFFDRHLKPQSNKK
jgi:acetyl esterase/lipase